MSIEIDHEKVAKRLALEIADLKYQLTAYMVVADDLQEKLKKLEPQPDLSPNRGEHDGEIPTV